MRRVELLSPAGNLEKLAYAYAYGADAAYIGIPGFSLRAQAENFTSAEADKVRALKGNHRLYCALNIFFTDDDMQALARLLPELRSFGFDAFIISDIGVIDSIRREYPDTEIHLSTQANCLNTEAAKRYAAMGVSRIIPGRELSLEQIKRLKDGVPEMEIETFVHGAMCLAYSGRCFLSAYMAGRSANAGACAHSCRWSYRVLEEKERPGEYFPVIGGGSFTTILSSKDLCLIDHLDELADAGIDAFKIEGRMKSLYYTAVTTRAYRKAIDSLMGEEVPFLDEYRNDLQRISHREYSTGFYFAEGRTQEPCGRSYVEEYLFLGTIGEETAPGLFRLHARNRIVTGERIEYIGPDIPSIPDDRFAILDQEGNETARADHGKEYYLRTEKPVGPGWIVRQRLTERS